MNWAKETNYIAYVHYIPIYDTPRFCIKKVMLLHEEHELK